MEQEFKSIAIIGGGASGCFCAYFLLKNGYDVTIFDKGSFLRTILPTGGGRCNLAHAEFVPNELARNYPRGEKFLYSIFSKFCTAETIEVFEEFGIKTYIQENGRIFPDTNSSKDVREKILAKIKRSNFIKEEVLDLCPFKNGYKIKSNKAEYFFDKVILAIGGHSSLNLIKKLDISLISQKPSLVGLNTENCYKELSGTVVKNVFCEGYSDDILFTHFGISGPLVYKISSIKAFDKLPYILNFDLVPNLINLQDDLNNNSQKELKNVLNKYLPLKVINYIFKNIDLSIKAHKVDGKLRDEILKKLHNYEIKIIGTNKGEETVSAGGIDLNEINPKTMELKKYSNLYAIGEVLNIDGFCGGFNLQNAWSTAYVASRGVLLQK